MADLNARIDADRPLPSIPTSREILGQWADHPDLATLRKIAKEDLGRSDVGAYMHWLERMVLNMRLVLESKMKGGPE